MAKVKSLRTVLTDAPLHKRLKIIEIEGGSRMRQYLGRLGLGIGSKIRLLQGAPFSGPLLIEHRDTNAVIGRGIASKIRIEVIE